MRHIRTDAALNCFKHVGSPSHNRSSFSTAPEVACHQPTAHERVGLLSGHFMPPVFALLVSGFVFTVASGSVFWSAFVFVFVVDHGSRCPKETRVLIYQTIQYEQRRTDTHLAVFNNTNNMAYV